VNYINYSILHSTSILSPSSIPIEKERILFTVPLFLCEKLHLFLEGVEQFTMYGQDDTQRNYLFRVR